MDVRLAVPLAGRGSFDVSDEEDYRIQIFTEKGNLRTPPASHWMKTTLVTVTRLFVGGPAWTVYSGCFHAQGQYKKFLAQAA